MGDNKLISAVSQMKKGGKIWLLLILIAAGVVFLFLGNSDIFRAAKENDEDCVHEEKLNIEDYEAALEEDIKGFCMSIYGSDSVSVTVRLSGSSQSIYAQNTQSGTGSDREEYVVIGTGSGAHLVYLGERSPEILGVGVIITGKAVGASKSDIESLISSAYGVPLNRIYVKIFDLQ